MDALTAFWVLLLIAALSLLALIGLDITIEGYRQWQERRRQQRLAKLEAELAHTRARLERATLELARELDAAYAEASREMARQAVLMTQQASGS